MRFLIDVVDLNTAFHSKYSRVISTLLTEAEARGGLGMQISASSDMIMHAGQTSGRFWDFSVPSKSGFWTRYVRAAQLFMGLALLKFAGWRKSQNLRLLLVWYFVYSMEAFSPRQRENIAKALDVDETIDRRSHFHHWLKERGIDLGNGVTKAMPSDTSKALTLGEDDIVVIAGFSGRYNLSALKKLKDRQGFRIVFMIYDLLPLNYPSVLRPDEYRLYRDFLHELPQTADLIVTPNEQTASQLRANIITHQTKARVESMSFIQAALAPNEGVLSQRIEAAGLAKTPFLLAVAPLKTHKHLLWIYALCSKLRKEHRDFPMLVIAGQMQSSGQVMKIMSDPDWSSTALFIDTPSDSELSWLYSNTQLVLYPSFEGGTGMPVMEAMKFGRPCITSDAPALTELAGPGIRHLPRDESLWRSEILNYLSGDIFAKAATQDTHALPELRLLDQIEAHLSK